MHSTGISVGENCREKTDSSQCCYGKHHAQSDAGIDEIRCEQRCHVLWCYKDCLKRYVPYRGESLDVQDIVRQTIDASSLSLFESGKIETDAQEFVNSRLVYLHQWLTEFASSKSHFSLLFCTLRDAFHSGVDDKTRVIEVVDIEECIWAPQYGLKGRIDASLSITAPRSRRSAKRHSSTVSSSLYSCYPASSSESDRPQSIGRMLHPSGDASKESDQMVIPMEFKTGKPYFTHTAQVDTIKHPTMISTLCT